MAAGRGERVQEQERGKFAVRVLVHFKDGVLDPQGQAVRGALHALGYGGAENVRVGKVIDFELAARDRATAERTAEEICRRLLANPVMEKYEFSLREVGTPAEGAGADASTEARAPAGVEAGAVATAPPGRSRE